MKRYFMVLFIVISCIAIMTGCSEDPKKRFLTFASEDDGGGDDGGDTVFYGPSSVTATDGNYRTKVGINWATVSEAKSYNIYRADSEAGPFTTRIASVNAADLVNVDTNIVEGTAPETVTTTATGGTCDVPVMQATYTSTRNIGSGIRIQGGIQPLAEHYTIRLEVGGVNLGLVKFDGRSIWLWDSYNWTASAIAAEFNKYLGSYGTCYAVSINGGNYIRIVSTHTIRLTNQYDLPGELLWVPLKFIDSSANSDTVINSEPVMIACDDITSPTVSQTSPASGATNIALNSKISVAFSEAVNTSTLNESTFTLSAGGSAVEGTVSNTGVFTPTSELVPNTQYTATITTGVEDLAGNNLASNYVWTFTTSAAVLYYYIDTEVTEGTHYYYSVTAVDKDGKESKPSPVEEGFTKANDNVPSKVPSCTASDGLAGGITVTWGAATNATYYRVYRISDTGQTQIGGDITDTIFTDTTVEPGVFTYKVAPFNAYGEGGSSDKDTGYRAVSDYEFFDMVYSEEESALSRINNLQIIMDPNSSLLDKYNALKSETVYDLKGSGKCVFSGSYNGNATINIAFTNYCDILLMLNGTQTTVADDTATGTITGTLNVSGVYPGYVKFNLILTDGSTSGGTYTVKQGSGSEITIPGTYVP